MKALRLLALAILVGFGLLLLVGFENVLAIFRYRVTLFLLIAPLFLLFLWSAYKTFGPRNRR